MVLICSSSFAIKVMVLPCRFSCWIYYTAKSGGVQWLRESGFSLFPCISAIYGGQSPGHRWYRPVVEATSPTPRLTPVIYLMAIPHNSKCRYGERGAAVAKPKAQIILDVLSSILATQEVPCRQPPERCLSRKVGIVRCCLIDPALPGIRRLPQPPARRAELL